jgi:hypothetical protein
LIKNGYKSLFRDGWKTKSLAETLSKISEQEKWLSPQMASSQINVAMSGTFLQTKFCKLIGEMKSLPKSNKFFLALQGHLSISHFPAVIFGN